MKLLFIPSRWAVAIKPIVLFLGSLLFTNSVVANPHAHHAHEHTGDSPIGTMGDHNHEVGEWMLSYRFMRMSMEGSLQGDDSISADAIATTIPNIFFGMPMMPATLRVVPLDMKEEMHMLGAMYGLSEDVTLMFMLNYIDKTMDHLTYMGGMPTTMTRGVFTTTTRGMGDSKASAIIKLRDSDSHKLYLNAGISIPTGSIDEQDRVLTPMGTEPEMRLPYPMQLGSGTWDLEPGLTYTGVDGKLSWGAQGRAVIRIGENSEDYTLGDQLHLSGWGAFRLVDNISASIRVSYSDIGDIDGQDPEIMAPVQTANPDNAGGERIDAAYGLSFRLEGGQRIAVEYIDVIEQEVNGVQLEMTDMLVVGIQAPL